MHWCQNTFRFIVAEHAVLTSGTFKIMCRAMSLVAKCILSLLSQLSQRRSCKQRAVPKLLLQSLCRDVSACCPLLECDSTAQLSLLCSEQRVTLHKHWHPVFRHKWVVCCIYTILSRFKDITASENKKGNVFSLFCLHWQRFLAQKLY